MTARAPFRVVIPARYESSRLTGKPLADIAGKPMIQWVYEAACRSAAAEVIVATDDDRIAAACRKAGARVEMTGTHHASGTDRIAELAERLQWRGHDIVVNVQGDEPLLPAILIDQVADLLDRNASADLATLTAPVESTTAIADPNVVKVVVDRHGFALYFSRAAIPFARDGGVTVQMMRHVGIYAYRVRSLKILATTPPCRLEEVERLEQLRALWLGQRIVVAEALEVPPRGVDTGEDLNNIRRIVTGRT
jgi:3-deoxy-manno-octulosonate cytidylyltransferase (CMP-KDO synthetase)